MHAFFHIGPLTIPAYGCMIVLGVLAANLLVRPILKRKGLDWDDFFLLELYCFLGGMVGAKGLYLLVARDQIDWSRILDLRYLNEVIQGGFVFYGGLIGGLAFLFLGGKIQKIDPLPYVKTCIFLIPFIHSFGRIGCFLAGCCYGIPYCGPGAVVFPEGSFGLSGVSLFPVQLLEAAGLMVIALALLFLVVKLDWRYAVETYLISYGILRFLLEYLRFDKARGAWCGLSVSQWISIGLILAAVLLVIFRRSRRPV